MLLLLFFTITSTNARANLYNECRKLFNPLNYMDQLPNLSLPYVDSIPIPNNMASVKPTPPIKPTKVISIATQYIYRNPVCVKVTGKKNLCDTLRNDEDQMNNNDLEYLVTKEYFVSDRNLKQLDDNLGLYLESSEDSTPFVPREASTPKLSSQDVKDLLIEDRLDQLESILPHYTRRKVYQTSTITVTKVRNNNRATATLLVKNCIPQGYKLCPPKVKKRKSKVARLSNSTMESNYYG